MSFCDCIISLNAVIVLKAFHVVACDGISFLRLSNFSFVYTFCLFFHMSKDAWVASTFWHTGMQISLQDPAFDAGIAGLYSNSLFSVLKNSHTVFRNTCTILQPHQQWTRVTVSSHFRQYLFPVSPPIFDRSS